MNNFAKLLRFVKASYPKYAYDVKPDIEPAVDGLIFRPEANGNFCSESGEQEVTLDEAIQLLKEDLQDTANQ